MIERKDRIRMILYAIVASIVSALLLRVGLPVHITADDIQRIVESIKPILDRPRDDSKPDIYDTVYDAKRSTYRISHGRSGCSATCVGRDSVDGSYILYTAAHCVDRIGDIVTVHVDSNTRIRSTVIGLDKVSDACVIRTQPTRIRLYSSRVYSGKASNGVRVWHIGYGIDKPGNREEGSIIGYDSDRRQYMSDISVSSGDSGSGVHTVDGDYVVGTVCCTVSVGGRRWTQFTDVQEHVRLFTSVDDMLDVWQPIQLPTIVRD